MLPALQLQGSSLSMALHCPVFNYLCQVHPWKEMMTKDEPCSLDTGVTEEIEMVEIITRKDIQEEGEEENKLRK